MLPFVDTSPGKAQEYFSDGLAEELLNELAKNTGASRGGADIIVPIQRSDANLRTVGQKLNVATVLEGSVSTDGNRVRIAAELVNVDNGFQLWSGSYERNLNDVFAVQDEIARAVAAELKVKLLERECHRRPSRAAPIPTPTATTCKAATSMSAEPKTIWRRRLPISSRPSSRIRDMRAHGQGWRGRA